MIDKNYINLSVTSIKGYIDGLIQNRRLSIADALGLRLFCIKPSMWYFSNTKVCFSKSYVCINMTLNRNLKYEQLWSYWLKLIMIDRISSDESALYNEGTDSMCDWNA